MLYQIKDIQAPPPASPPGDPVTALRVALPAPQPGVLQSLIVVQTDGDLDGFSVELFTQQGACVPNYPDEAVAQDLDGYPPQLYLVMDPLVVDSGEDTLTFFSLTGQPYSDLHDLSRAGRHIYLKITPQTSVSGKVFAASYNVTGRLK